MIEITYEYWHKDNNIHPSKRFKTSVKIEKGMLEKYREDREKEAGMPVYFRYKEK